MPYLAQFVSRSKDYLLFAGLLLSWEIVARVFAPSSLNLARLFPPPSEAISAGIELISRGQLHWHVLDSTRRVLTGWTIASTVAIALGLAMAWWPRLDRYADPLVEVLRPVPPIAWIPLSILWLGTGEAQMASITSIGAFFAVLLSAVHGARSVDQRYVRAAQCLGATQTAIFKRVILWGALPEILLGMRIGLGLSWMSLVAAELVAAQSGIAFLSQEARYVLRTDRVILTMVLIGALGVLCDRVLSRCGDVFMPWARAPR